MCGCSERKDASLTADVCFVSLSSDFAGTAAQSKLSHDLNEFELFFEYFEDPPFCNASDYQCRTSKLPRGKSSSPLSIQSLLFFNSFLLRTHKPLLCLR